MVAVLAYVDGFGHDTDVVGIFPSLQKAREAFKSKTLNGHNLRYDEFEVGLVSFDWYDAKNLFSERHKKS